MLRLGSFATLLVLVLCCCYVVQLEAATPRLFAKSASASASSSRAASVISPAEFRFAKVNAGDMWDIFDFLKIIYHKVVDDVVPRPNIFTNIQAAIVARRNELRPTNDATYDVQKLLITGNKSHDFVDWTTKKNVQIPTLFDNNMRVQSQPLINSIDNDANVRMHLRNLVDTMAITFDDSANLVTSCETLVAGGGPVGMASAILSVAAGCKTHLMENRPQYVRKQYLAIKPGLEDFLKGLSISLKPSVCIRSLERALFALGTLAGVDISTTTMFAATCAKNDGSYFGVGIKDVTKIPDQYTSAVQSQALCANVPNTVKKDFKLIVDAEGTRSRLRNLLGFEYKVPATYGASLLVHPILRNYTFNVNRAKFGVLTLFLKLKHNAPLCQPNAPVDWDYDIMAREYEATKYISKMSPRTVVDVEENDAKESWLEYFIRDDYAQQFLFTHRKILGLAGDNVPAVWDNAPGLSFDFDAIKKKLRNATEVKDTKKQIVDLLVGPSYSFKGLLEVTLKVDNRKCLQRIESTCKKGIWNTVDMACAAEKFANLLTDDPKGGASLWFMQMKRMKDTEFAGNITAKFAFSFEGDSARESYFPFGAGLDLSVKAAGGLSKLLTTFRENGDVVAALKAKNDAMNTGITDLINAAMMCMSETKLPLSGRMCDNALPYPKVFQSNSVGYDANMQDVTNLHAGTTVGTPTDDCEICVELVDIYLTTSAKPVKRYCKNNHDDSDSDTKECREMKKFLKENIGDASTSKTKVATRLAEFSAQNANTICKELGFCPRKVFPEWYTL